MLVFKTKGKMQKQISTKFFKNISAEQVPFNMYIFLGSQYACFLPTDMQPNTMHEAENTAQKKKRSPDKNTSFSRARRCSCSAFFRFSNFSSRMVLLSI